MLRMQDYRLPVYRPKAVLGIISVILYRLWPENNYLGNSAGADCNSRRVPPCVAETCAVGAVFCTGSRGAWAAGPSIWSKVQ